MCLYNGTQSKDQQPPELSSSALDQEHHHIEKIKQTKFVLLELVRLYSIRIACDWEYQDHYQD
jgi:hypothetical protein